MCVIIYLIFFFFFFFNDTATTEIYTLSLHDALPIFVVSRRRDLNRIETLSMAATQACRLQMRQVPFALPAWPPPVRPRPPAPIRTPLSPRRYCLHNHKAAPGKHATRPVLGGLLWRRALRRLIGQRLAWPGRGRDSCKRPRPYQTSVAAGRDT